MADMATNRLYLQIFWILWKRRHCAPPLLAAALLMWLCVSAWDMFRELSLLTWSSDPSDSSFLLTEHCPACYGNDLCTEFRTGHIQLQSFTESLFNYKNVYMARWGDKLVALKSHASNAELAAIDERLCGEAGLPPGCRPSLAARLLVRRTLATAGNPVTAAARALPSHSGEALPVVGDMLRCASPRLVQLVANATAFPSHSDTGGKSSEEIGAEVLYSMYVNTEPLLLKVSPSFRLLL